MTGNAVQKRVALRLTPPHAHRIMATFYDSFDASIGKKQLRKDNDDNFNGQNRRDARTRRPIRNTECFDGRCDAAHLA